MEQPELLSREERHENYKRALELLKKNTPKNGKLGLCALLILGSRPYFNGPLEQAYPELASMKPEYRNWAGYWWPLGAEGDEQRINALEKCIQLTAP